MPECFLNSYLEKLMNSILRVRIILSFLLSITIPILYTGMSEAAHAQTANNIFSTPKVKSLKAIKGKQKKCSLKSARTTISTRRLMKAADIPGSFGFPLARLTRSLQRGIPLAPVRLALMMKRGTTFRSVSLLVITEHHTLKLPPAATAGSRSIRYHQALRMATILPMISLMPLI